MSVWINEEIQLDHVQAYVMEGGDRQFLSFLLSREPDVWGWVMIEVENGWGIAWLPDLSAFDQLVRSGEIEAEIDGMWIRVLETDEDFFSRFDVADSRSAIAWETPLPLRKVQ